MCVTNKPELSSYSVLEKCCQVNSLSNFDSSFKFEILIQTWRREKKSHTVIIPKHGFLLGIC